MPRIEEWELYTLRPHDGSRHGLHGRISGRAGFSDGTRAYTSELVALQPREKIAVTRNSVYELGEVSPDFVESLKTLGKSLDDLAFDNREKTCVL